LPGAWDSLQFHAIIQHLNLENLEYSFDIDFVVECVELLSLLLLFSQKIPHLAFEIFLA
jgi:hypothetical protein